MFVAEHFIHSLVKKYGKYHVSTDDDDEAPSIHRHVNS
jgi:hypothetical protein